MKRINFKHFFLFTTIALFVSVLLIGCQSSKKKESNEISVQHTFANTNWAFEEQVLDFPFSISDTTKEYSIEFVLNYDTATNKLRQLPVTITLIFPDGQETYVTSIMDFDREINKSIMPAANGNGVNLNLVAFPRKQLNQKGEYHVSFFRKAEKGDNFGFNNLTLKVLPIKNKKN